MLKLIKKIFSKNNSQSNVIGKFQVINLLSQRVPFELICVEQVSNDLKESIIKDATLAGLFTKMQIFELSESVLSEFNANKTGRSKDAPVLLFCNTGKKSAKLAAKIAKMGYKNLYILDNGFQDLV